MIWSEMSRCIGDVGGYEGAGRPCCGGDGWSCVELGCEGRQLGEVYYVVACDAGKKGVVAVDFGSNCCCKNRENKRGKLGSSGCGSLRYQAEVQGVLPAGGCWVRFGFRRRHVLVLCCSREEEFTREQLLLQ